MNRAALTRAVDKLMDMQEFSELDIETQVQVMSLAPAIVRLYLDEMLKQINENVSKEVQ